MSDLVKLKAFLNVIFLDMVEQIFLRANLFRCVSFISSKNCKLSDFCLQLLNKYFTAKFYQALRVHLAANKLPI